MRVFLPLAVLGPSCLVSSVSAQGSTSASQVVTDILKLSRAKVDEGVIVALRAKGSAWERERRGSIDASHHWNFFASVAHAPELQSGCRNLCVLQTSIRIRSKVALAADSVCK